MKAKTTSALEKRLGHEFRDRELLERALTHTSHAHEAEARGDGGAGHNEQFEFLGDAVLGLATSEELLRRFPHFHEGQLSKLRAHLVSEKHLMHAAGELQLGDFLRLGRGEERTGGRAKPALLADALEAVIGALYLDAGFEVARRLVCDHVVIPELERMEEDELERGMLPVTDHKSTLQEIMHTSGRTPEYVLVGEQGPEHQKTFTVEARLLLPGHKSEYVVRGKGSTKKKAEQDAARQALEYLRSSQPDEPDARPVAQPPERSRAPLR